MFCADFLSLFADYAAIAVYHGLQTRMLKQYSSKLISLMAKMECNYCLAFDMYLMVNSFVVTLMGIDDKGENNRTTFEFVRDDPKPIWQRVYISIQSQQWTRGYIEFTSFFTGQEGIHAFHTVALDNIHLINTSCKNTGMYVNCHSSFLPSVVSLLYHI